MRKINKYLLTGLTVLTLGAVAIDGSGIAHADNNNLGFGEKFAQRFGLNEDEVNSFMQEMHKERLQERDQDHQDRLIQAVEDGVLTQEQKEALEAKHQAMTENREQLREDHREEMDTWFTEQGIDRQALDEYMGNFGHRGGFHI